MSIDIAGIGALATAAKGIADKFWPDKTEMEKAVLAVQLQEAMNEFKLATAQTDINLEEAKSTNWFVAGWRPYIGWICGTGLGYQFLLMPLMNGLLQATFKITPFIALDTATLTACLSGLLGLGAMRSFEKSTGAEANRSSK